jgi:hypothetical protein
MPLNAADWATVASAVFTAGAAAAALATVRQGRQVLDAAERPLLEVQVLAEPPHRLLAVAIVNSGQGTARGANFAVHALGTATDGVIGDGFVMGGDRVKYQTTIGPLPTPAGNMRPDLDDLGAMVAYRDAGGYVHYRTHDGREYVPKTLIRRRPKYPDRVDAFRRLFPNIAVDAAQRGYVVELSDPDGPTA